jgi:integrase
MNDTTSRWEATATAGLRRCRRTGTYYLSRRIHGRVVGRALGTTDAAEALVRYHALVAELLAAPPAEAASPDAQTLGALAGVYLRRTEAAELDAKTREKRGHLLGTLRETWAAVPGLPAFDEARPDAVTYDELLAWKEEVLEQDYSVDYFNRLLQTLRSLWALAAEFGAEVTDAADRLERAREDRHHYVLPTAEQLARILAYNDGGGHNGSSRHCRDWVEAVSYTGLRRSEAWALRVSHIDLAAGIITLPATASKGVRGRRQGRIIPILPDARPLFERLVAGADAEGRVFHVAHVTHWLRAACAASGWTERFTPHSLRHFFATRCLEAGVPVQTVAAWLGHKDNGRLLLSVYAHVCGRFNLSVAQRLQGWSLVA